MNDMDTSKRIPVMEHYYTIQGEGAFAGYAAYFIRLAGCDVGCVWCDVKESWNVNPEQWMDIAELVNAATSHPSRMVVITGGEPLMYDLKALTESLKMAGFKIHLETSGAYPLSGEWDWICVSPKKFKSPLEEVVKKADELKVIVYHPSDFDWGNKHAILTPVHCRKIFQPEWDKRHEMEPLIIEYVKSHPSWTISIQTHKYLDIP
jgi:organic radical activating enzyme